MTQTTEKSPKLPPVLIFHERPRCPDCGGVRLPSNHTDQNGDGSITRHCRCSDCGRKVRLILE